MINDENSKGNKLKDNKNQVLDREYTQRVKRLSFLNLLVSKRIPFSYVEDDCNRTRCSFIASPP